MFVSKIGSKNILSILKKHNTKATLFCTANFVFNAPELIKQAIYDGHEIACHGVDHWRPKKDDPKKSKEIIDTARYNPVLGKPNIKQSQALKQIWMGGTK